MIQIEKITSVVTTEDITINPGTYFFKYNSDDVITYRRYIVEPGDRWSLLLVKCTDEEKAIREEFGWYNLDYNSEQCFLLTKGASEIIATEFYYWFDTTLEYLNTLKR